MLRVVVVLVVIGVTVYALVDCARTGGPELRLLPKPVWLLVILILAPLGGVLYLVAGRAAEGVEEPGPRPLAPDDDPEFLRRLDLERRRRLADEQRRRRRAQPGEGGNAQKDAPGDAEGDDHSGHPA
jgi:hypothetical protein